MPPETRWARPLVSMLRREKLIFEEPPTSATKTIAATAPTRDHAERPRKLQRSAASTARPASKAMKLDCEKVGTRPIQRTAIRRAQRGHGAALLDPQQRRHHDDDDQRQIPTVDVGVPKDRVDPEVGVEFVRADHLVVPEQAPGRVLDRADQDESNRLDRNQPQHPSRAASDPNRSRSATRRPPRTARRRSRRSAALWRSRPSRAIWIA